MASAQALRSPRLALVSIDLEASSDWEDPIADLVSFNYGLRKLEASIRACPELADVETRVISLGTKEPEAFLAELEAFRPSIVALSLYVWSIGPLQELAARIKAWDPEVRLIVGGPHARASVFSLSPYRGMARSVDAAVAGEGEQVLRDLVRLHQGEQWRELAGLWLPGPLGWRSTGPLPRPELDAYPSPYQLGTAPHGATGYLETFRGCPIHCSFCQWGEQASDRVHSAEYLRSHLIGMRERAVPNVFVLDAAFNLSPRAFRALAEAEREVGVLRHTRVHGHLYPTLLTEEHVELLASFGHAQLSVGVQSLDPKVLARLGRPFDLARFHRVLDALRTRFEITLELMLGLPGDDPASFRETFERTVSLADNVRVFKTLVLPDALLDRADVGMNIDFDPETFLLRSCTGWTADTLRREFEHVARVAEENHNAVVKEAWVGFHTYDARRDPSAFGERAVPDGALDRLRHSLGMRAPGWHLRAIRSGDRGLWFELETPGGEVVLEAVATVVGRPRFVEREGVSYSHRGALDRKYAPGLVNVIDVVHHDAASLVAGRDA